MPTYDQLLAAQNYAHMSNVEAMATGLPPGFGAGFKVTWEAPNLVKVGPGAANVDGQQVAIDEEILIDDSMWLMVRVQGHFYIYLTSAGEFEVDTTGPIQSTDNDFHNYHPITGARFIGRLYVDSDGDQVFAATGTKAVPEVIVGAFAWTDDSDYLCDGTGDDVEVNAAIRYLSGAFGGGIVRLSPGTFNLAASIELLSNILLEGAGRATVLDPAASVSAIEATGSDGSEIVGSEIRDLKIKRSAAPSYPGGSGATNHLDDIDLNYADRFVVSSVECDDDVARVNSDPGASVWSYAAIRAGNCDDLTVRGCNLQMGICGIALDSCSGLVEANNIWMSGQADKSIVSGIQVLHGTNLRVENNRVTDLLVGTGSNDVFGILVPAGSGSVIKNNIVENIRRPAGGQDRTYGILAAANNSPTVISGNIVRAVQNWDARGPGSDNKIAGISVHESNDATVNDNYVEDSYVGIWVESVTRRVSFSGNRVINCGQLIDYGHCEDSNEPMVLGETVPLNSSLSSYARSTEQVYDGSYSYKGVSNGASDLMFAGAVDAQSTSDMHGLLPGVEYTLELWGYVPAGGIDPTDITTRLFDYVSAWDSTATTWADTTGAWQKVTVTRTILAAATGTFLRLFSVASGNHANTEEIFIDNVRLYPTKSQNAHENLLKDEGTDTRF